MNWLVRLPAVYRCVLQQFFESEHNENNNGNSITFLGIKIFFYPFILSILNQIKSESNKKSVTVHSIYGMCVAINFPHGAQALHKWKERFALKPVTLPLPIQMQKNKTKNRTNERI